MKRTKKEKIIDILMLVIGILATVFLIISAIRDYYFHGFLYMLKNDIILFLMGVCCSRIIDMIISNLKNGNDER